MNAGLTGRLLVGDVRAVDKQVALIDALSADSVLRQLEGKKPAHGES
jgi:hypothetical protein